ncbi:polymeric immunoglobulin receptor-like [Alligator mississippiensis]|nr:polymeric immunoglobulin receptor-like [Alligator mississippiensis]
MCMLPLWLWILFPVSPAGSVAVTGPRTVRGTEGGSVSVTCRYDKGYEKYGKFWCREGSSFRCFNWEFILETNGSEANVREGRFSIQDNHSLHVFTVSMEHLTKADVGTYHCGVLRLGLFDPRHAVEVIVSPVSPPGSVAVTGPRTVTGPEGGSVSVTCRYDKGYEKYGKFWCREGSSFHCFNWEFILQTNGSEAKVREGRFSIQDNHSLHVFTVSMEHLTKTDAGVYHCGVLRLGLFDPRHAVEVIVSPVLPTPVSSTMETPTSTEFTTVHSMPQRQQKQAGVQAWGICLIWAAASTKPTSTAKEEEANFPNQHPTPAGRCNEHVIHDYVDSWKVTKALLILLFEYFSS